MDASGFAHFERTVLPHLAAGYNLARWLLRDQHDAEDVVQDATLRALRGFDRYRGGDARAWYLAIVRNACYSRLRARASEARDEEFDELRHTLDGQGDGGEDPLGSLARLRDRERLLACVEALPAILREALILRELEGMTYKEIAEVIDVPIGTVMSRLARARDRLQRALRGVLDRQEVS